MKNLKVKTALNKLMKGEIVFHSVFDERMEPVKMVDGKLLNPETNQEWAFSDLTQFYKTKEDGEKALKDKKAQEAQKYNQQWDQKESEAVKQKKIQDDEHAKKKQNSIQQLMPVLNKLNTALNSKGLEFILHTNEKHYPCPAIHMRSSNNWALWELCSEIYLTDYESKGEFYIKSGSCNMHKNKSKNVDELISKIMDKMIQSKIA